MQVDGGIVIAGSVSFNSPTAPTADLPIAVAVAALPLADTGCSDPEFDVAGGAEPDVTGVRPVNAASDHAQYEVDDIKTEYHPNSGQATVVSHFDDFTRARTSTFQPPRDDKPWRPFASRTDFEFAELVLATALSKKQVDALLKLVHRIKQGKDDFTFTTYNDIQQAWADASPKVAAVRTYLFL